MRPLIFALFCCTLFILVGCQEETPQTVKIPPQSAQDGNGGTHLSEPAANRETATSGAAQESVAPAAGQESTTTEQLAQGTPQEEPETAEQQAPTPPIFEDFQGAPQLSLFPRVGDYRPAENSDQLPYWSTFIEHLVKVTGVAEDPATGSRGWVFRSIKSIDSVGYFSPLSVEPQQTYQVSFTLAAELAEGASAGIGILEFNEFLWVAGQYTEETFKQHYRGSHEGQRLVGTSKDAHSFTFTTGPDTRMIHIVLFREGPHDRNPVMFDDITIEELRNEE